MFICSSLQIDITTNDFYKFGEEKFNGNGLFTKVALGSKHFLFAISSNTVSQVRF